MSSEAGASQACGIAQKARGSPEVVRLCTYGAQTRDRALWIAAGRVLVGWWKFAY